MIKLKSLIKEGSRLNSINKEIEKLNSLWDKYDSTGDRTSQLDIETQLKKLNKEKSNWENIYKAIK